MTRIAFIMPTYNRADYIAQSVESVLAQMSHDDELIVVDDGSSDDIEAVLAPYKGQMRFIQQANAGKSTALNNALSQTTADYIWICDDDDLLSSGAVEFLHNALASSDADLVFGHFSRFREEAGQRIDLGTGYWPDLSTGSLQRHTLEDFFAFHNATLAKRSLYVGLGGFDTAFARSQDYEMLVRAAVTASMKYVDTSVFLQRVHDGARGPARQSHGAGQTQAVWQKFDRILFERLRDHVPASFFVSMFESTTPELAHRAGLLQRACILARHGLWAEALEGCKEAAKLASGIDLHPIEREICRRMTAGKHGFAAMLAPELEQNFKDVASQSRHGRAILAQVARGLFWRLRSHEKDDRSAACRFLARPHVVSALVANTLKLAPSSEASDLIEREPDREIGRAALKNWLPR